MKWKKIAGTKICAPLSISGDYVISHRGTYYVLSYRPTGKHIHVGNFVSLKKAKIAAQNHTDSGFPGRNSAI